MKRPDWEILMQEALKINRELHAAFGLEDREMFDLLAYRMLNFHNQLILKVMQRVDELAEESTDARYT